MSLGSAVMKTTALGSEHLSRLLSNGPMAYLWLLAAVAAQEVTDLECGVVGDAGPLACHQEARAWRSNLLYHGEVTTNCPGLSQLRGICPRECPYVAPHSYLSCWATFSLPLDR